MRHAQRMAYTEEFFTRMLQKKQRHIDKEYKKSVNTVKVAFGIWNELFKGYYDCKYKFAKEDVILMSVVIRAYSTEEIKWATVSMFRQYVTDLWYTSRQLVPSIRAFHKSIVSFVVKGKSIYKFINPKLQEVLGLDWWVITVQEPNNEQEVAYIKNKHRVVAVDFRQCWVEEIEGNILVRKSFGEVYEKDEAWKKGV